MSEPQTCIFSLLWSCVHDTSFILLGGTLQEDQWVAWYTNYSASISKSRMTSATTSKENRNTESLDHLLALLSWELDPGRTWPGFQDDFRADCWWSSVQFQCSEKVHKFTVPGLQDATIIVAIVKELMRPCILPGCLEIGRDIYTRLPKFMACKENWAWLRGIIVGYGRIWHLSWRNKSK